jgi:hypothetical protein
MPDFSAALPLLTAARKPLSNRKNWSSKGSINVEHGTKQYCAMFTLYYLVLENENLSCDRGYQIAYQALCDAARVLFPNADDYSVPAINDGYAEFIDLSEDDRYAAILKIYDWAIAKAKGVTA